MGLNFFIHLKQLFAIFITRQLTGNLKESIIPYIRANIKQIKIIDKSHKFNYESEPNQELIKSVDQLQRYATNFLNLKDESSSTDKQENQEKTTEENLYQPEVESLMPVVSSNSNLILNCKSYIFETLLTKVS